MEATGFKYNWRKMETAAKIELNMSPNVKA